MMMEPEPATASGAAGLCGRCTGVAVPLRVVSISRKIKTIAQRHLMPTLCNPMDYSLPSSSISGILQARILARLLCPSEGNEKDGGGRG